MSNNSDRPSRPKTQRTTPDPLTGAQLLEMGKGARQSVELDADRWFQRADLADAYVQCAADQLDQGSYTHAFQLLRRAGEVCPSYATLYSALYEQGPL